MEPTSAPTEDLGQGGLVVALHEVTSWLDKTWKGQRTLGWPALVRLGNEQSGGRWWQDDDIQFLIKALRGDQAPTSPEQLAERVPAALAATRSERQRLETRSGEWDARVAADRQRSAGDWDDSVVDAEPEWEFPGWNFNHEDGPATLRPDRTSPEEVAVIWFGPEPGKDTYLRTVQGGAKLARMNRFSITGFTRAAHVSTAWLQHVDDEDDDVISVIEATPGAVVSRRELVARFRWPRAQLRTGELVDVCAADVRFTIDTQRFVSVESGRSVSLNGEHLAVIRDVRMEVLPATIHCGSIIEKATLAFGAVLRASSDGKSSVEVHWTHEFTLYEVVGGLHGIHQGTFELFPNSDLGYAGSTARCFRDFGYQD